MSWHRLHLQDLRWVFLVGANVGTTWAAGVAQLLGDPQSGFCSLCPPSE